MQMQAQFGETKRGRVGACCWENLPKGESPVTTHLQGHGNRRRAALASGWSKQTCPELNSETLSEEVWDKEKLTWERKQTTLATERPWLQS